jgi:hypothetical protein
MEWVFQALIFQEDQDNNLTLHADQKIKAAIKTAA